MFVESALHRTCFLGPQIQGPVLLALIEFLSLSLVNDGDRFMNDSDLGESGSHAIRHFSPMQLHLQVVQLFHQLLLLLAAKVLTLNLGHGCRVLWHCFQTHSQRSALKIRAIDSSRS